jgi:signal transduction histidine kinase
MEGIDFKTTALKSQIEKYYDGVSEVHYDVYDLLSYDTNGGTDILKSHVEKTFPGMEFTINNIQGDIVYKDFPKLIYKNETKSYLFEIKRQISFKSNLPFKSIELSIRFNFLKIIFQSLLISSVLSAFLILPILVFYVNTTIKPLFALAKAASEIAKGKYGVKVNFNPKDEIGQVIKSFNYMSEELSKMKEIRDDLLATVSHELRSPLGRIRGYTELMLDIDLPEKDKKSFYESILSEIDLLNNMVGEILEVSRLEMKKERLFLEVFDMKYFFEMLSKELEVLEKAKNVEIEYSCIENLFCEIDVEKIKNLFMNQFYQK